MTALIVWIILTTPTDRLVCELWTRTIPTQPALVQACGTDALGTYRLDVLPVNSNAVICSRTASAIATVREECQLEKPLDEYVLRIIEPSFSRALCSVTTAERIEPNAAEVSRQCPNAPRNYVIKYGGTVQPPPDPGPTICKPPAISQPSTITTSRDLHLLAGKLIWYGLARGNCPNGLSGVDPSTFAATACGMDGARPIVLEWQNQLDAAILASAREWNVPAMTLKEIIIRETQFWIWTGVHGEHGLIQITDDGAAVVLHVYMEGYYQLNPERQRDARAAWLRSLDCEFCSPADVMNKARADMSKYSQALAAYYCMYGSWDRALDAWNTNHKNIKASD